MGKLRDQNFLRPTPSRQGKTFRAPAPLLKSGTFLCPSFNMSKNSSYLVKTTPKHFVPPPSVWLKHFPPPLTPCLFVGVTLHMPPSRFVAPSPFLVTSPSTPMIRPPHPSNTKKQTFGDFQYEAALAVDSVRLVSKALSKMLTRDPHIFTNTLRHGKFYNNGTEGIDCDSEPVIPWRHGYAIMKAMREVLTESQRAFFILLTPTNPLESSHHSTLSPQYHLLGVVVMY